MDSRGHNYANTNDKKPTNHVIVHGWDMGLVTLKGGENTYSFVEICLF